MTDDERKRMNQAMGILEEEPLARLEENGMLVFGTFASRAAAASAVQQHEASVRAAQVGGRSRQTATEHVLAATNARHVGARGR